MSDEKLENIDGEDGGFEPIGSPGDHSSEPITGPEPSVETGGGEGGEEAYNDFVQQSNEIGVEGAEPAIEEI